MCSALVWITFTVLATVLLFNSLLIRRNKKKKLPPSPRGLPILGHLHLLGKNPHQDLHKLSKQYGSIMHLRFGFISNIIVSSPNAAEQFLKTYDLVFASRPAFEAAKYMSFGQRNLSCAQYGSYWRDILKLCTLNLLSDIKIRSFESMRREELGLFVESLKQAALNRDVVDISTGVLSLNANMSCLMVVGKKYEDKQFDEKGIEVVMRMKAISKVFDEFFEKIVVEHEKSAKQDRQADDFVYTMLALVKSGETDFQLDRRHIKAILLVSGYMSLKILGILE